MNDTMETTAVAVREEAPVPAPVIKEQESLLPAIVQMARDPNIDVAKLDAIMQMQFKLEARKAERDFIEAFARLSARLPRIKKEGVIDLGKGKPMAFARIEDMDRVVRPLLAAEGFTLSYDSAMKDGGGLIVTGHLMHSAGHSRTATIPLPMDQGPGRNNLQAVGSTLAYGKRYLMEMLLNLVRENSDDDGHKGGMRFITQDEADDLRKLMQETGSDEQRLCGLFNIAHVGEMPEANLTAARNMLLSKKKKA